jgi:hypothetical protein
MEFRQKTRLCLCSVGRPSNLASCAMCLSINTAGLIACCVPLWNLLYFIRMLAGIDLSWALLRRTKGLKFLNGLTDSGSRAVYICSGIVLWLPRSIVRLGFRSRLCSVVSRIDCVQWLQELIVLCALKDRLYCVAS